MSGIVLYKVVITWIKATFFKYVHFLFSLNVINIEFIILFYLPFIVLLGLILFNLVDYTVPVRIKLILKLESIKQLIVIRLKMIEGPSRIS